MRVLLILAAVAAAALAQITSTCPPSGDNCAVDTCVVTGQGVQNVALQYTCGALLAQPSFFFFSAVIPAATVGWSALVKYHLLNGTDIAVVNSTNTVPVDTAYAYALTNATDTEAFLNFTGNLTADGNITLSVNALQCVPQNLAVNQNTLTWTSLGQPNITYSVSGVATPNNSYTIPSACAKTAFTVTSILTTPATGPLTCPGAAATPAIPLTPSPTAPTINSVTFNATTDLNVTEPYFNSLEINVTLPDLFACSNVAGNEVFYKVVSADGLYSLSSTTGKVPLESGAVRILSVSHSTNVSLDTNQVYTVTVTVTTAVGLSESSVDITLPGYNEPSSGLSNTVIAGIAVGATVGVVAIALIIYKCSTSRKGYESIDKDSRA